MIEHLLSYSLADFVPLDLETYLRLFSRANDLLWPIHLIAGAKGVLIIILLKRKQERFIWLILSVLWIFNGGYFHGLLLAELVWAASYSSHLFIAQGILMMIVFFTVKGSSANATGSLTIKKLAGQIFIVMGLAGTTLLSLMSGRESSSLEWFGIAPDPICMVTIGILLFTNSRKWWLLIIPVLWVIISAIASHVLQQTSGSVLFLLSMGFSLLHVTSCAVSKFKQLFI